MKLKVVFWVIFGSFLLLSAWLRIGIPYDDIAGDTIRFPSVDAYYHLKAADYTYENWPEVQRFDPLLTYPDGEGIGQRPLNSLLIATIAKFGGISVNTVGLFMPAVLGVLILIPVLFIGWLLWGKWAALIGVASLSVI